MASPPQTEGAEKDDVIQMGEQAGREQGRRRARKDWLGEIFISRGRRDESGEGDRMGEGLGEEPPIKCAD